MPLWLLAARLGRVLRGERRLHVEHAGAGRRGHVIVTASAAEPSRGRANDGDGGRCVESPACRCSPSLSRNRTG